MRHRRTKKKMQKPRSPAAAFATRKEERGKNEKEESKLFNIIVYLNCEEKKGVNIKFL